MDLLNSIGFVNFWGVTPFMDLFKTERAILSQSNPINILLSNANDLRHFLYTLYKLYVMKKEDDKEVPELHFYIHEDHVENLCRDLLFMHLITDRTKSVIERCEIIMEIYGNTLLPSRTIDYINSVYKQLISFICGDKKSNPVYKDLFDFSCLTHKEIDEMVEVLSSYDSKIPYDIEKYRNDRVRYALKDRYDYRNNLFDWDYNMNLAKFAPIVRSQHYMYFRNYGVAFEMRINRYKFPNRTLSSYIQGRSKESKDSCMVRGFWGDIVNSPYIGYGLELETREEQTYFYANNKINYLRDSQDVTEYNMIKILLRLDHNGVYDFMKREYEKEKRRKEKIKAQQEQEEQEAKGKKDEKKEEEINTSKPVKLEKEDNTIEKITEKVMNQKQMSMPVTEEELIDAEGDDPSTYDPNELLSGFKEIKFKIHFVSGDIEKSIYRKNKFKSFFDVMLYGFHCQSKFDEKIKQVIKPNTRILFELNKYMASFTDKQREEYTKKVIELNEKNGFVLDDESLKYIYQFKLKPVQPEAENEK